MKSKSNLKEKCEECERPYTMVDGRTLCDTCAAAHYWALKKHIQTNLAYWRVLAVENAKIAVRWSNLRYTPRAKNGESAVYQSSNWANLRYNGGVAFERRVKHMLEDLGYFVVRSAGSKGKADLVAIRNGVVLVIQCKRDFRPLADEEKTVLLAVCKDFANTIPIHARYFNRVMSFTDLRTGADVTEKILSE